MNHADLQRALIAHGHDLGKGGPSGRGDDGVWGDRTTAGLIAFQRARGLLGDVGEQTRAALLALPSVPATHSVVPAGWLPAAQMSRIIVHWTAGHHTASADDRKHYHILIEGDGKLVRGTPSIALNDARGAKAGYAAHTLNCNTGSISVSLCGMAGAVESPFSPGRSPLTVAQWDTLPAVLADLCRRYGIAVGPRTILSHAEVQGTLGIAQRGKWDIARLPFSHLTGARAIGDDFRAKTAALL